MPLIEFALASRPLAVNDYPVAQEVATLGFTWSHRRPSSTHRLVPPIPTRHYWPATERWPGITSVRTPWPGGSPRRWPEPDCTLARLPTVPI
jgi:hypothetical protein